MLTRDGLFDKQTIYLLSPTTGEVKHTYESIAALRSATGIGASAVYRRLSGTLKSPFNFGAHGMIKGVFIITNKLPEKERRLQAADPNAEYVVMDGDHCYGKGSLEKCKGIKASLRIPTVTIKPWQ